MNSASISPRAKIGKNVKFGAFTVVHDNVEIHDNTVIESHCLIGEPTSLSNGSPLVIGENSHIRSHSIFYEGSQFGAGLHTGHSVIVRERTIAGVDLQIGTLSDLQGHLKIGDHTRTHSNVHIGQGTEIGSYVWIFPYTVFTNDPHPPSHTRMGVIVEDFAVIATMVCILPGVRIGQHALVGAGSVVNRDVKEKTVVAGNPAKELGPVDKIKLKDGTDQPAYPWNKRFFRGYPEHITNKWKKS